MAEPPITEPKRHLQRPAPERQKPTARQAGRSVRPP